MATELHWPRRSTFVELDAEGADDEEHRYIGPGTFEVPDEMVDAYLDRGWERPDEDQSAPPVAEQDESESTETEAEANGGAETADASEVMADEADAEGFDAAEFVDESWQSVVSSIEDGEADGHLDAVESAELERESGPRESSVMEAIEARR